MFVHFFKEIFGQFKTLLYFCSRKTRKSLLRHTSGFVLFVNLQCDGVHGLCKDIIYIDICTFP